MPATRRGVSTDNPPKQESESTNTASRRRTRSGGGESKREATLTAGKNIQTSKSLETADQKTARNAVNKPTVTPKGKTTSTCKTAAQKATPVKKEVVQTPARTTRANLKQTTSKISAEIGMSPTRSSRSQSVKSTEVPIVTVSTPKGTAKSKHSDEKKLDSTRKSTPTRASRQNKEKPAEDVVMETPTRGRGRPKSVDTKAEKETVTTRKSETGGSKMTKDGDDSVRPEVIGCMEMSCEEGKTDTRPPSVTSSLDDQDGNKDVTNASGTSTAQVESSEDHQIVVATETSQQEEDMLTEPPMETRPYSSCTIATQTPIQGKGRKRLVGSKESGCSPKKVRPGTSSYSLESSGTEGPSTPASQSQTTISPRKSSRQSKPNRWFADMQVEFGKKEVTKKEGGKKEVPKKEAVKKGDGEKKASPQKFPLKSPVKSTQKSPAVPISIILDKGDFTATFVNVESTPGFTQFPMDVSDKLLGKKSVVLPVPLSTASRPQAILEPPEIWVSGTEVPPESQQICTSETVKASGSKEDDQVPADMVSNTLGVQSSTEPTLELQEVQVSTEVPNQSPKIRIFTGVPPRVSPTILVPKRVPPVSHKETPASTTSQEPSDNQASVEVPQEPSDNLASVEVPQEPSDNQASMEVRQEPSDNQASVEVPQEPLENQVLAKLSLVPAENQGSIELPQEPQENQASGEVPPGPSEHRGMIQTVVLEFKSSESQTDVATLQDESSTTEEANTVPQTPNSQMIAVEDSEGRGSAVEIPTSTYKNLTYTKVTLPVDEALTTDSPASVIVSQQDPITQEPARKTQEYVIVHLPEGATVQQKDIRNKPREDDSRCIVDETTGMLKCLDCDYLTSKKTNWYKHKRKHMGIRPYVCSICNYKSTTGSNLKRHMAIHKDIRTHECTTCGLMFRQKIHLERHQKYKHEEKSVKCPMCDYVCANENPDLKIHIKRRHVKQPTGAGFTCEECSLVILSRRDYKQHLKFHRRGPELKLFCEHCSFVTDCESRLNRHVMIHSKLKPFKCGLCEYRGSQKEHVLRHMRSQHALEISPGTPRLSPSVTPQTCSSGDVMNALVTTETTEALIMDEEDTLSDSSEHSPEPASSLSSDRKSDKADFSCRDKIFACNHCTMKFSKLINLYKHLHTQHRSIMPASNEEFSCVVCEFKTNTKKNLLVHMRKHNLHDQAPPSHVYSCVLCSYVNPKRRNLFQHMKKKHKIEIVMKDDGSANCFIAENSNVMGGEVSNENLMTVGDIVTTSTENQLTISENIQRLVSIADLANAISLPHNSEGVVYIEQTSSAKTLAQMDLTDLQVESINAQHEAAEAIQGLQALAEQSQHRSLMETPVNISIDSLQANPLETVQQVELMEPADNVLAEVENVITGVEDAAAEVPDSQVIEGEIAGLVSAVETVDETAPAPENRPSIQLSAEQLMNLSSGDYVEINGEMYKVEFTSEDGAS